MRKILLALSVIVAFMCCVLTHAAMSSDTGSTTTTSTDSIADDGSSYAVSIGTVEAQRYSSSGLSLSYFTNATYVAQTDDNTYMGFDVVTTDSTQYARLRAISSSATAATVPDNIKIDDEVIPVTYVYYDYYLYLGIGKSSNTKWTLPKTITYINNQNYIFGYGITDIYMLGEKPTFYYSSSSSYINTSLNVYVCDKSTYGGYAASWLETNANSLQPYGWELEWVTVNVEKEGEFAEVYLTENNYSWSAVQYLKVTGNINDTDLSAMQNLSALYKLDLTETEITSIPARFWYANKRIREVKLPNTLTKIGDYAFYNCTKLESFELNGITNIGSYAFYGCTALPYLNLNGATTINERAFYGCTALVGIDLSTVSTINARAFYNCTSLESLSLENAASISDYAFYNCSSLKNVELSSTLTSLGSGGFYNTGLESIIIPESIATIPSYTFYNCTSLASVELPKGLTTISSYAFYGCTALEEITIPSTVKTMGNYAFDYTGINKFTCYAAVPPTASTSFIGSGMDMTQVYLYVPPFSKDFYRNTSYWSDFYLMKSIEDNVDYIYVDRSLAINLEEEDNDVVANNPEMDLTWSSSSYIGQLTATGEGTLSLGELNIVAQISNRSSYSYNYMPTLINYADKMRADNVNIEFSFYRYSGGYWSFISLPFDAKVSDVVPGDNTYWVIRRYDSAARASGDTSETWVDLTEDDTLEAGKGYIVSVSGSRTTAYDTSGNSYYVYPNLTFTSGNTTTKNNIFRSTNVITTLTEYEAEYSHNRSWNLVGNPYPSYFDMHYLNEDFTAPVTVWNGSAYVAYSPVDDDLVLAPYEAFFVQCPLESTEMTFYEEGRLHSADGKSSYNAVDRNKQDVSIDGRNVFNFNLSADDYEDRARVVINPEAKAEYEIGRDASKFFADSKEFAQIYISSNVNYSIDERPLGDGFATLGLRSANQSIYTLTLSGKYSSEWNVYLTDNLTGNTVDLTCEDYEFTSNSEDEQSRFTVCFAAGTTGISSIAADFGMDAQVIVSNLGGVVVFSGSLSDVKVPTGIYLISNGNKTIKTYIK